MLNDEKLVRELCKNVYGEDGQTIEEKLELKIIVNSEWGVCRDSLFLFGKQIACAYGRDSGAKIGNDVRIIKGSANSGGSVKNWRTEIEAGSELILKDVSKSLFEKNNVPDVLSILIIKNEVDKESLKIEKTNLLKRLEEINNILGE